MATDFDSNAIVTSGGIKPSTVDTPADIRTRVKLLEDIMTIPLPYLGMIVYCEETDCYYKITKLTSIYIGPSEIKQGAVSEYELLYDDTEIQDRISALDNTNNNDHNNIINYCNQIKTDMYELNHEAVRLYQNVNDDINTAIARADNDYKLASNDIISYEFKRDNNTDYVLTRISKNDNIELVVTYNTNLAIPRQQSIDNNLVLCCNAGLYNTSTNKPIGLTIKEGEIVGNGSFSSNWFLAINKNTGMLESGRLSNYETDYLAGRYNYLITAFVPIILNGHSVSEDILADCPNYSAKHPRQIICQKEDGEILLLTSDGRIEGQEGWTLLEAQDICLQYDVMFAYNLDGGGSAQTVYNNMLISTPIDNNHTEERAVLACLGVRIHNPLNNAPNHDTKEITRMIGDLKAKYDSQIRELITTIESLQARIEELENK